MWSLNVVFSFHFDSVLFSGLMKLSIHVLN
jgi:hypothetical protein